MIAAVMAAGSSKRFGGCKQTYLIEGKPMVCHVVEALPSVVSETLVIIGSEAETVKNVLTDSDVRFLLNENHQEGVSSSIKLAASYAKEMGQSLLVTFADLPFVSTSDYETLIREFEGEPVFSSYSETHGPPAVFPLEALELLMTVTGDKGAKSIFENPKTVMIANAAKDIDFES